MKKLLFLFCLQGMVFANIDYKVEKITDGLGVVWGFDFLDDNTIIFNQKSGKIGILNLTDNTKTLIDLPFNNLYAGGQGGLLDLQIHDNGFIYITSSREYAGEISTVLSSFKLENNKIADFQDLFISKTKSNSSFHFGSRITFADNFVYFSIGDRGNRDSAQDLDVHNGSIIKLNLNGSIPENNPKYRDKLSPIYSYGHRNPQGLFFDKSNNQLISIEHGPRGGDEINLIKKGANYGWPIISYGKEYFLPVAVGEGTEKEGMEQPIYYFTPSIAPSDLLVYRSKNKELDGLIVSSALKLRHLNIIKFDKNYKNPSEYRILTELKERIRSITQYGENIYFSTDSGNLYKLSFK